MEVKSSVAFTTPELSESEWKAAEEHGDDFVLAVVDFLGSPQQALWYAAYPRRRRPRFSGKTVSSIASRALNCKTYAPTRNSSKAV